MSLQIGYVNSPSTGEGIFRLCGSVPCLLMPWLLKSPGHQQAWYLQYRIGNMYTCSILNFISQIKSKIWYEMLMNILWSSLNTSKQWLHCIRLTSRSQAKNLLKEFDSCHPYTSADCGHLDPGPAHMCTLFCIYCLQWAIPGEDFGAI